MKTTVTTIHDTFGGKINSIVALLGDYYRGRMPWAEVVRRADLTPKGATILAAVSKPHSNESFIRATVTAAVQAGY